MQLKGSSNPFGVANKFIDSLLRPSQDRNKVKDWDEWRLWLYIIDDNMEQRRKLSPIPSMSWPRSIGLVDLPGKSPL